jgi:L-amino acid N-acyltransferase YncA
VRPLDTADLDAARAIYNHWVATSTATFHEEPLGAEEFAAEIVFRDPRYGAYAVDDAAGLAGYVVVAPYKSRCAYRDTAEVSAYLRPDARGLGLGREAVDAAVWRARTAGLHALLATICAENTASIRLFESCGFARVAHLKEVGRKFGRWLDVVILELLLGDPA